MLGRKNSECVTPADKTFSVPKKKIPPQNLAGEYIGAENFLKKNGFLDIVFLGVLYFPFCIFLDFLIKKYRRTGSVPDFVVQGQLIGSRIEVGQILANSGLPSLGFWTFLFWVFLNFLFKKYRRTVSVPDFVMQGQLIGSKFY